MRPGGSGARKNVLWTVVGWVVWGLVAFFAIGQWSTLFTNDDRGVRAIAGRTAALLTVGLVFTALTQFSKLHLLWYAPVVFYGSMLLGSAQMNARKGDEGKSSSDEETDQHED